MATLGALVFHKHSMLKLMPWLPQKNGATCKKGLFGRGFDFKEKACKFQRSRDFIFEKLVKKCNVCINSFPNNYFQTAPKFRAFADDRSEIF